MTVKDWIKKAAEEARLGRLSLLGRVVDCLRFKHRLDYAGIEALFGKHAEVTAGELNEWMMELDYYGDMP